MALRQNHSMRPLTILFHQSNDAKQINWLRNGRHFSSMGMSRWFGAAGDTSLIYPAVHNNADRT